MKPAAQASFSVGRLTVARQRHEIGLLTAKLRSDARGELVTVHDGHGDVDHRDGRVESIERRKRLGPVVRHGDLVARAFQEHREEVERVFVVVDEQDASAGVRVRDQGRGCGRCRRGWIQQVGAEGGP